MTGKGAFLLLLGAAPAVAGSAALQPQRLTQAEIAQLPATGAGSGTSGVEGIRTHLLSGDPSREGPYTIMLSVPANTRIAAHRHKDDRVATIVSGTWNFGYGPVAGEDTKALGSGSFYTEPAGVSHFARTGAAPVVLYIHGIGPTDTEYTAASAAPRRCPIHIEEAYMSDFSGKNILILGGSRGIGAAIVRRFAAGGGRVTFTYAGSHNAAEALAAETGATAVRADSAERADVLSAVRGPGALDVIVINAGTLVMGDPLTLEPDAIDRMIDINVRAPYHASVEAARQMNADGRIIIIGSVNADRMPFAGGAAYAMSKAAIQGMVRGLARDFGDRGITVNSIQPGPTDSEMNPSDGPMAATMHGFMAIKRHARGEEIAEFAAYLAGPHGAMITGSMQTIDGGFGA